MSRFSPEEIERVRSLEQSGRLTPAGVVDDARDPDSPLHDRFEWDDAVAAAEHRLDQARALIRSVEYHIVRNTITITAPRYIPDPARKGREGGYRALSEINRDRVMAVQAVLDELRRTLGSLKRLQQIADALEEAPEIAALVTAATQIRDRLAALANGAVDATPTAPAPTTAPAAPPARTTATRSA